MNATEIRIAQDAGKVVLVADMDRTFDVMGMSKAGVEIGRLLVTQPDNEGQALDVITGVLKAGVVDVVIFVGPVSPLLMTQVRNTRWIHARRDEVTSCIEMAEIFQA